MQKTLRHQSFEKILIRSTNWIGDAIMTTPAIRSIRHNFPAAKISILAWPWVADIFVACPDVDEVIIYEKQGRHRGILGILRLARELSARRFDLAVLLQNAFEAALLTTLAGIPVRAGYSRDGRGLLLSHPVPVSGRVRRLHQVHYYQGLLRELGLYCGESRLSLSLPKASLLYAEERVAGLSGPLIGLNPGAAYGPAKCWPAERYAALAGLLAKEQQATILVFGTDKDRDAAALISRMAPGRVLDLAGKTTLAEAMALIGRCNVFVTNDSGLMHVAAAQDTPLVAIFGSTDSVATGPFCARAIILKKSLPCAPCLGTHCKENDFACMNGILVEEVYFATCELLRRVGR